MTQTQKRYCTCRTPRLEIYKKRIWCGICKKEVVEGERRGFTGEDRNGS